MQSRTGIRSTLTRKFTMVATSALLIGALAMPSMASAQTKPPEPPPSKSPCFDILLDDPRNDNHVSLCHFTGGTNFVLNEPSISAFTPHTSHHGDCYKFLGEEQVCVV
jgi:hypothetical protein